MSDDRVGAGRGPYRVDPQLRGQFRDPVETGPSGRFGRSGTGRQEVRLRIVIGNADRSGHPPVPSRAPCAASVASASITGAPVAGRGLQNGQGAADQSARAERRGHGQLRSPSRVPGGRQGRGGSQRRGALGRPSRSQAARHGEDDRPAAPLPTVPCEPKASPLRPAPAPPPAGGPGATADIACRAVAVGCACPARAAAATASGGREAAASAVEVRAVRRAGSCGTTRYREGLIRVGGVAARGGDDRDSAAGHDGGVAGPAGPIVNGQG